LLLIKYHALSSFVGEPFDCDDEKSQTVSETTEWTIELTNKADKKAAVLNTSAPDSFLKTINEMGSSLSFDYTTFCMTRAELNSDAHPVTFKIRVSTRDFQPSFMIFDTVTMLVLGRIRWFLIISRISVTKIDSTSYCYTWSLDESALGVGEDVSLRKQLIRMSMLFWAVGRGLSISQMSVHFSSRSGPDYYDPLDTGAYIEMFLGQLDVTSVGDSPQQLMSAASDPCVGEIAIDQVTKQLLGMSVQESKSKILNLFVQDESFAVSTLQSSISLDELYLNRLDLSLHFD